MKSHLEARHKQEYRSLDGGKLVFIVKLDILHIRYDLEMINTSLNPFDTKPMAKIAV